eukprot:12420627-Prorocentrum_lima.AAC.1
MMPRSGQDLNLGAIGGGRRRRPPAKHTPKGGLQKEEIERKLVQRKRDLDLLAIGVTKVGDVLPNGMVPARA